jgi:cation:H+ antiporter
MISHIAIFIVALSILIIAARYFTNAAEELGKWLSLPSFVIGIFIVGIGTSLPELISGVLSVSQGVSEILPGNIIGANISNLLLVTGFAVAINRKPISLGSTYIYIDLHFLLGSFFMFLYHSI